VFGRRFDAAGQPQGAEFRANTYTTGEQNFPSVAINERGDFTVVWEDDEGHDGSVSGVFGQRFDKLGNPLGQEFVVNTYTTGYQILPSVGMDEVGNFIVAWPSRDQDGSGFGVYAQRFGGILFPALGLDASPTLGPGPDSFASDGNGVLEPGETVVVETFWHNVSGVAQGPIGGHVNAFTGPPGPTYVVPDPNASFGVIPNGQTVGCSVTGDCYTVGVSGTRPVTHWDGVMEEGVNTIILGQAKLWALHVGESFTDVPRTSPFYRFIETLLHNGVTGGCSGTLYCPQNSTSREQMAVFVLVAAEGATFRPVPCGAVAMFNDVPASSAFCPWVEELARRGVVAGCGGGNYCPSAPVSREQMAVFVLRTLDGDLNPPACTTPVFADVPASSPFCRWIEELARRGVVSGCGGATTVPPRRSHASRWACSSRSRSASSCMGVDFGTPAARERIVSRISPRYRGEMHFLGLLAEVALLMGAALWLVRDVRPWEWLLVPAALVFGNGFEWLVHQGPLHHPWPARLAYNRHTLTHHAAFSDRDMSVRSWRELRIVLFPLYALPLLELIVLPVFALVWWTLGRNAAALFAFASVLYYLIYELLHLAYHLPVDHPVSRLRVVGWLKRHHQRHHDPREMTAGNFNVSIPLFDWLLGTRLVEAPAQRDGAAPPHSSAAEPSGATHTIS
jgi:hypothetical protein